MDFAKLDLRAAAEQETWVHLRVGDILLYADDDKQERPCRVKVASVANPAVEEALDAAQLASEAAFKARAAFHVANRSDRAGAEKRLKDAQERSTKLISAFLVTAIVDWENIESGGKVLEFSKAALADLCEAKAPLFRMANEIMEDMAKLASPFGTLD